MSDEENKDLEEEIPANAIVGNWDEKQQFDMIIESDDNFIEVTEVDMDENVEYVEYSDYNEDDERNEYRNIEIKEEITEDDISQQNGDALYHCSSCDVKFYSTEDHIREYHQNQSVIIEDNLGENTAINCDNIKTENDESEEIICQENEDSPFEMYSVYEFSGDRDKYKTISEEVFLDSNKRPYVRKKVKIPEESLLHVTHKCQTCKKSFTATELSRHKCPKGSSSAPKIIVLEDDGDNSKKEIAFMCSVCGKIVPARNHARHMKTHKDTELLELEVVEDKKQLKVKKQKEAPVPVTCAICNTTFPSNKSLRLHMRMHDPVKQKPIEVAIGYQLKACAKQGQEPTETFFCDICNKSYDKVFQEIHKKSHKSGPKFVCSVCNKKFANQTNLDMHLQAHQDHAKIKAPTKSNGGATPYECSFCGRQFVRPHEKVKHERIHTGEKPYKCEICGKCFRVSYCLTLHLRTHTAARPYVCPHCNKRFKAYSVYNHHLMTHSDERPYKCPHCPKAFKTAVQLGGHKNCHTKPFVCPECNRSFASLYAVKAHIEIHKKGGQNLKHRCAMCGAIYARIFALRDHIKEHHQNSGEDGTEIQVTEIPFSNENETSTQSILPTNEGEITIDEIEHFQTEEVVTDWLK